MRQEIFYLAYYLHWSYADIIDLDLDERRTYLRLLSEQLERESQAVNQAFRR